jgi:hypothetical protein
LRYKNTQLYNEELGHAPNKACQTLEGTLAFFSSKLNVLFVALKELIEENDKNVGQQFASVRCRFTVRKVSNGSLVRQLIVKVADIGTYVPDI